MPPVLLDKVGVDRRPVVLTPGILQTHFDQCDPVTYEIEVEMPLRSGRKKF
jgi:hypothetical protein